MQVPVLDKSHFPIGDVIAPIQSEYVLLQDRRDANLVGALGMPVTMVNSSYATSA